MATRAIVTTHPVLACDVCGRSLLRGESPDVFLADDEARTVCELCVPRAAAEGWRRETDAPSGSLAARRRRGGSLLGRLRQRRRVDAESAPESQPDVGAPQPEEQAIEEELYEFLEGGAMQRAERYDDDLPIGAVLDVEDDPGTQVAPEPELHDARGSDGLVRALESFNAGELPRRIAGVARSLGTPTVTVRACEHSPAAVAIVVAWELCWYRYEVDFGGLDADARLVAEGMELHELAAEDRAGNAVADERGELAFAADTI